MTRCLACEGPVPDIPTKGLPLEYCSQVCRERVATAARHFLDHIASPQPERQAVVNNHQYLMTTGYEVTAAALRDEPDKIRELFASLTAAETAAAAEGCVLAMALIVRELLDPGDVEQMITAAEAGAILEAGGAAA
ncbi:hypothetical protein ACFYRC_05965 [Streptomyces sp. NPDC005279]|uniref:hypothetical protein n=1 Tax=Streptomyces sp. NPDC005279 TaxID=3364712 RepID=UPI003675EFE7